MKRPKPTPYLIELAQLIGFTPEDFRDLMESGVLGYHAHKPEAVPTFDIFLRSEEATVTFTHGRQGWLAELRGPERKKIYIRSGFRPSEEEAYKALASDLFNRVRFLDRRLDELFRGLPK